MLTAAVLVLFTLLCITLSDDRAWDNVTRSTRNALVFQGRHQGYGAYVLRRDYERRFVIAFVLALCVFGGGIGLAHLLASNGPVPATNIISCGVDVELDKVYETRRVEEKKAKTEVTARTTTKGTGGTKDPLLVEAGSRVDSAKAMDPQAQVDTLAVGGGGKDPGLVGPKGGGGGETGGDPLGTTTNPTGLGDVDSAPQFPGGEARMFDFVQRNIVFPEYDGGKQKVYVEFIVDAEGNVLSVTARGKSQKAYANAAEKVVKLMPAWIPAIRKGKKVACRLVLPISFETK